MICACEVQMSCVVASGYTEPEAMLIVLGDDPILFSSSLLASVHTNVSNPSYIFVPYSDPPSSPAHPYLGDGGIVM
jgi:hypothetical protein